MLTACIDCAERPAVSKKRCMRFYLAAWRAENPERMAAYRDAYDRRGGRRRDAKRDG